MIDIYGAAYTTIRAGAPGLSDATCEVIARSIARKLKATAVSPPQPSDGIPPRGPGHCDDDAVQVMAMIDQVRHADFARDEVGAVAGEGVFQIEWEADGEPRKRVQFGTRVEGWLEQLSPKMTAMFAAPPSDALRIVALKLESIRMMRSDRAGGPYPKSYKGGFDAAADLMSGWAEEALAALKAEAAAHG